MSEFYEFVGLMLGDGAMGDKPGYHGCLRGNSRFCVALKDLQEMRERVLISIGVTGEGGGIQRNAAKIYVGADMTERLGWSNGKTIPELSNFDNEQLESVLRGLFESDGSVDVQRDKYIRVRFSNYNQKLAEFVYQGLKRIGINSTLRPGREREFCVYVVKRNGNLDLFKKKVGFITDRKRRILGWENTVESIER